MKCQQNLVDLSQFFSRFIHDWLEARQADNSQLAHSWNSLVQSWSDLMEYRTGLIVLIFLCLFAVAVRLVEKEHDRRIRNPENPDEPLPASPWRLWFDCCLWVFWKRNEVVILLGRLLRFILRQPTSHKDGVY